MLRLARSLELPIGPLSAAGFGCRRSDRPFSGAVEDLGGAAVPVIERAVAGAREPDELTALVEAG